MRTFFLILTTVAVKHAASQQPETSVWTALQLPVDIGNKWQWHNDAGYRTIGFSQSAYQYLFRTGARFFVNKKTSVAAGTAFFFTRASFKKTDDEFGNEFRIWQELNHTISIGKGFLLQNRIRTEERWFDAMQNKSAYYAFRFRYRVSGTQQLSAKWSVQLADEYMQQAVDGNFSFNQNRVIGTIIYQPEHSVSIQGGYMWMLRQAISQHAFIITFQKSISLNGNSNK